MPAVPASCQQSCTRRREPKRSNKKMHPAVSRDNEMTKQNSLYIELQLLHSFTASLFRTSLEMGQDLRNCTVLKGKKHNSILCNCIIRNTSRKICVLPATPEICYATPRGVATPSLGSPVLADRYLVLQVLVTPLKYPATPFGVATHKFGTTDLGCLHGQVKLFQRFEGFLHHNQFLNVVVEKVIMTSKIQLRGGKPVDFSNHLHWTCKQNIKV